MFLEPSLTPIEDLETIAYPNQPINKRMYHTGYEKYMELMPQLKADDELLTLKVDLTHSVMAALAEDLKQSYWIKDVHPALQDMNRVVLAMEKPTIADLGYPVGTTVEKTGTELVVGLWGNGFYTPIHGHSAGYLHEQLLFGKLRVNTYRLMPNGKVRFIQTEIATEGYSKWQYSIEDYRTNLIHNFTVLEPAASLHYFSEHTRDGRNNTFDLDLFHGPTNEQVERLTPYEVNYLNIGDVVLVRSANVPDYGDHYVVVTGKPVLKPHGLRPQTVAITAPNMDTFLTNYEGQDYVALKLADSVREEFLRFHGIKIANNQVILPR
jgi:hypothetical protein